MNIRRLGTKQPFKEFDDDDDCPWCDAAWQLGPQNGTVHLENDKGGKRTVKSSIAEDTGQQVFECEPYVFFRDD